jgi:hypothetical protein
VDDRSPKAPSPKNDRRQQPQTPNRSPNPHINRDIGGNLGHLDELFIFLGWMPTDGSPSLSDGYGIDIVEL